MEDYVILIGIMWTTIIGLVGIKLFKGSDGPKRAKKEVQDSAHKEVISSKDLTITTLKDELRSIKGKLYRNQQLEAEEEEELATDGRKPVRWDEIQALVNTQFPKYAKLLPLIKNQVMDATKGMSMEEVLQYVKQFTGNQQSQGQTVPNDAAGYNPNWA